MLAWLSRLKRILNFLGVLARIVAAIIEALGDPPDNGNGK